MRVPTRLTPTAAYVGAHVPVSLKSRLDQKLPNPSFNGIFHRGTNLLLEVVEVHGKDDFPEVIGSLGPR